MERKKPASEKKELESKTREQTPSNSSSSTPINCCVKTSDTRPFGEPLSHPLIVPVWMYHGANPEKEVLIYAIFDEQSDACFIKDSVLEETEELQVSSPQVDYELSTVLATKTISNQKIYGLVVRG